MKKLISILIAIGLLMMTVATVEASDKIVITEGIDLYVKANRDAQPIPVEVPVAPAYPHFDDDKLNIVYFSDPSEFGLTEIWKIAIGSVLPTQLTSNSVPDVDPSWSPDGTKIAWVSQVETSECDHDFSISNLWIMDADGNNKEVIACGAFRDTSWSGDGDAVAVYNVENYYNSDEEVHMYEDIYTIDIARSIGGGGITRITTDDDAYHEHFPDWSSNGKIITYTRSIQSEPESSVYYAGGVWAIYVENGAPRQVAYPSAYAPSFSPDDKRIMFSRNNLLYSIKSSCNLAYQNEWECDLTVHPSVPATKFSDWGFGDGGPILADLIVNDIRMEETTEGSGLCHLEADIKNIGTSSAGASDTQFYLYGLNPYELIGICNVPQPTSVDIDEVVTVECTALEVSYNSWGYLGTTEADYLDTVSEFDEGNNHGEEGGLNCPMPI